MSRGRVGSRLGRGAVLAAAVLSLGVAVSACGSLARDAGPRSGEASNPAAEGPGTTVEPPPAGAAFDYQLGGAYEPPGGVTVVARDATEAPADGLYSLCYVNGFQTQPGANWPDELILHDGSGEPVRDPDWPDETLLDSSTASNREAIADQHAATIEGCAGAGFRAVEFDNLDSYTRSDGMLTLEDAVDLAAALVEVAHANGLAAAQKNTAELGTRGRDEIGFDFAVSEECDRWDECGEYTDVFGEHVFNIEYADDLRGSADEVCARDSIPASTIVRDRELTPAGSPDYFYLRC
jgi:hypothetical protein